MLEKLEDIAGFNVEGYIARHFGGLKIQEFIPTSESFQELKENPEYLGVCFVVDNIEKRIWVYQDSEVKGKKYVKTIKGEKKENKLTEITNNLFSNVLNYDTTGFTVHRALDNMAMFSKLFKYQINEYPLYTKHYFLPQYEHEEEDEAVQEEAQAEVSANIKKCVNCGWIISAGATVCPKCRRSPREKFEG